MTGFIVQPLASPESAIYSVSELQRFMGHMKKEKKEHFICIPGPNLLWNYPAERVK